MPICNELTAVNGDEFEGQVSMLRCKRWSCPICAPENAKRVRVLCARGNPNKFMTLTINSDDFDCPHEAARFLKASMVKFRRALEASLGIKKLPFLCVFEKHKSGYPHLHLAIRTKYLPWQVLRGIWKRITGAHRIDIRKIDTTGQLYFYMTKYMTKSLEAFEGCKRWWRSHNYDEAPDDEFDNPWARFGITKIEKRFHLIVTWLQAYGYDLEQTGTYRFEYRCRPPSHPKKTTLVTWRDIR